jgi:hypothetical protein
MGLSYVHLGSVPHVDTIERFSETNLAAAGGATTNGTAAANGGGSA